MIIGIDLGTTNSLATAWREGKAELIKNPLGEYLTPSAVGLADNGDILVGKAARERLLTHPEHTTATFKRYMGSANQTWLGDKYFTPEELSALVLKALKEDAEHHLQQEVTQAIISVPAYFNDTQRKATRLAGQLAGLEVLRLINEPTAAALAYGLHQKEEESRFLVFDLGGGTFDVSILEMFDGVMEVHASAGDNFLGGEDFTNLLLDDFLSQHGLDIHTLDSKTVNSMRMQMEQVKRTLNNQMAASIQHRHGEQTYDWNISSERYEQLSRPLLERLRLPVERALRDAKLQLSDIDEILLVGGSTRKMLIQKLVSRMFGRLPLRQINPDEVVAMGAAVQAGLVSRDEALSEICMTDVCPYTLGLEVSSDTDGRRIDGLFSPILERNTIIPASRVEHYSPLDNYQTHLSLCIYQGESPQVKNNVYLGELELPLPRKKKNDISVEVRFTYDVNGILEVEAKVDGSDQLHSRVLQQQKTQLSDEEIRQSLAKLKGLKIHPRDQAENQHLLARAARIYEESLEAQRNYIGKLIADFMAVLDGQDPKQIHRAQIEIKELLEQIEKDWF